MKFHPFIFFSPKVCPSVFLFRSNFSNPSQIVTMVTASAIAPLFPSSRSLFLSASSPSLAPPKPPAPSALCSGVAGHLRCHRRPPHLLLSTTLNLFSLLSSLLSRGSPALPSHSGSTTAPIGRRRLHHRHHLLTLSLFPPSLPLSFSLALSRPKPRWPPPLPPPEHTTTSPRPLRLQRSPCREELLHARKFRRPIPSFDDYR